MDDQDFLTKFSCLGTQDRDVLVNDLHEILGSQLSREGCIFFLEMTNWNLQAAVGAYYDFYGQSSTIQPPQVCVVKDFPIADGGPVPPGTSITKTWTLKNAGAEPWPVGAYICQWSGHTLGASSTVTLLPCLRPGEEGDVSVTLLSPHHSGFFQSQWKMFTSTGSMCGGTLFITVIVEDSTVLGVTQQMQLSAITNEGDMDTGGGGGASLLGDQRGSRTSTDRTLNPFGGSPSLLAGYPDQFDQSSATILPNLIPSSLIDAGGNGTMATTGVLPSHRQLQTNNVSELNTSITVLTDRMQADAVLTHDERIGSDSTQLQPGNGTRLLGTGTRPQERGNVENTMSSDDFGI